jgi:hypothetical protein
MGDGGLRVANVTMTHTYKQVVSPSQSIRKLQTTAVTLTISTFVMVLLLGTILYSLNLQRITNELPASISFIVTLGILGLPLLLELIGSRADVRMKMQVMINEVYVISDKEGIPPLTVAEAQERLGTLAYNRKFFLPFLSMILVSTLVDYSTSMTFLNSSGETQTNIESVLSFPLLLSGLIAVYVTLSYQLWRVEKYAVAALSHNSFGVTLRLITKTNQKSK